MISEELSSIKWSIVTVSFNSENTLRQFWSKNRPVDVEWIVVDNNSSDSSADLAEELGASVVRLTKNLGFSAANNIGLRHASGKYVAFANPDIIIDYQSMELLSETIDKTNGLISPQLIYSNGDLQPNGRGFPSLFNKIINRITKDELAHNRYNIVPTSPGLFHVAWLMGAAACASKRTFEEMGGWNTNYFVYFEDSEIGLRANLNNIPVLLDTRINWVHGWARDTNGKSLKPRILEMQGALKFYKQFPSLIFHERFGNWKKLSKLIGTKFEVSARAETK